MKPSDKSEYALRVQRRLSSKENVAGRPLALKEVAKRVGYSYEHVRQALLGRPVGSRRFNDELAKICALDADEMWRLASKEKAVQRYGSEVARTLTPPPDRRMVTVWERLTESERLQVLAIAEGLVARRQHRRSGRR